MHEKDYCAVLVIATQLLIVVLLPQGVLSLKMVNVKIPRYVLEGEEASLECKYDLENDLLYSVTWYKDHEEFYRYVPKAAPQKHTYTLEGIRLLYYLSNEQFVFLSHVSLQTSGLYRCEVSGEGPLFKSVQGEGRMEVMVLPEEGPLITGQEGIYEVGDDISLNCTSGKSFPAARLTWYINGSPVPTTHSNEEVQEHHDGLMTSVIGLKSVVTSQHFLSGHMQIRCVATISPIPPDYGRGQTLPAEDNREAFLLIKGDASRSRCSTFILWLLTSLATWLVT